MEQQLELFSISQIRQRNVTGHPQLVMSAEALLQWKQRIFEHQQSAKVEQSQQGTLFEIAANPYDSNEINPFGLQFQNLSCLELPDPGDRTCLYFVVDNTLPLLLYVGETELMPKQRWVNHYCNRYILHYIELHRRYSLDVAVGIAFWYGAHSDRKQRLKLESELIQKWKSPFNKECWVRWGQPCGK